MKINLTLCGVKELPDQGGKRWTHVVSIWDKVFLYDLTHREKVKELAPRAKMLFSFFEDTDDPNRPEAPRLQDVKRILAFTNLIPAWAKVLVHCRAGISRSTTTAYAILCQHTAPGTELENLLHVQSLRDLVMPNRLIIEHADKILKREGVMRLHHSSDKLLNAAAIEAIAESKRKKDFSKKKPTPQDVEHFLEKKDLTTGEPRLVTPRVQLRQYGNEKKFRFETEDLEQQAACVHTNVISL